MKLVVTNGCFDILHAGHVSLLREARAQGDRLVVLINSDESVRFLKGPTRPVNPLWARVSVLWELRCVDLIIPFANEGQLIELIRSMRPDVLVKGAGSADAGPIPGADLLVQWDGRLYLARHVDGYSTSEILAYRQTTARTERSSQSRTGRSVASDPKSWPT